MAHKEGKGNTIHGWSRTRTYACWGSMISRCYNPNATYYKHYGGRGIEVCQEWREDFMNFLRDMGPKPEGLTLERVDNDGDYEPKNCKWATVEEQSYNRTFNQRSKFGVIGICSNDSTTRLIKPYRVRIVVDGVMKSFGTYTTLEEATEVVEKIKIERRQKYVKA
jgi:hypothetical protein